MLEVSSSLDDQIEARANEILARQQLSLYIRTDRMFACLLLFEWLAGIIVALVVSPRTWAGRYNDVHVHVWAALILGSLIVLLPVLLAIFRPGLTLTRHTIAMGQMLYSALLIHLSGGRIETHFHVFGSLAFLGFYRDWRVLIPATVVVAADHLLRGLYFPMSVYGVNTVEPWRWFEHSCWVLFEDFFLVNMCISSTNEMKLGARQQAELEKTNINIENLVEHRTKELKHARAWAEMQYKIARHLAETKSWKDAIQGILSFIGSEIAEQSGKTWGAFWTTAANVQELHCEASLQIPHASVETFAQTSIARTFKPGEGLPGRAWTNGVVILLDLSSDSNFPRYKAAAESGLSAGIAFPVCTGDHFTGTFEFVTEHPVDWHKEALESLAQQLGMFASRKEAEKSRERLAQIVEHSSDAIITTTADGTVVSWNKGAERAFSYQAQETRNREISSLLNQGEAKDDIKALMNSLLRAGERVENYETSILNKEKRNVDVTLFAVPWFDDSGNYDGCSLTLHNITERKQAERRVAEFYSIVSHELRTPLTSIRGVLGLFENGTIDLNSEEAIELICVARSSSDRLIRLINDMLDLKKIESGKMELQKTKIDVSEIVACATAALAGMAETASVKLVQKSKQSFIYADWDKATQVITNLISNAIKFSPPQTEILITTQNTGKFIRFSVKDNGPGIADADQPKLFDKFQQLDSSDTRNFGGTGLGLAICKALVEEHQGQLGVISKLGEGSEFWFELPVYTVESTRPSPLEDGARSYKILIIDDDTELRRVLSAQLSSMGVTCLQARDGPEALSIVRKEVPDLIILDVLMPELDGFALVQLLKQENKIKSLPVIIYTCKDLSISEMKALSLGNTRYLLKGESTQDDLRRTINELLKWQFESQAMPLTEIHSRGI